MTMTSDNFDSTTAAPLPIENTDITGISLPAALERLVYFNGRFLKAEDMRLEQRSALLRLALAERAQGPGVSYGFHGTLNGDTIAIEAGHAADGFGSDLYLSEAATISVKDLVEAFKAHPATCDAPGPAVTPKPATSAVGLTGAFLLTLYLAGKDHDAVPVFGVQCGDNKEAVCSLGYHADAVGAALVLFDPLAQAPRSGKLDWRGSGARSYFGAEAKSEGTLLKTMAAFSGSAPRAQGTHVPIGMLYLQDGGAVAFDEWTGKRLREPSETAYWLESLRAPSRAAQLARVLQFQSQLADALAQFPGARLDQIGFSDGASIRLPGVCFLPVATGKTEIGDADLPALKDAVNHYLPGIPFKLMAATDGELNAVFQAALPSPELALAVPSASAPSGDGIVALFEVGPLQIVKMSKRSDVAAHPSVEITMPPGFKVIGGGGHVEWHGAGSLLTSAYPSSPTTFKVEAKDHLVSDPSSILAFAYGARFKDGRAIDEADYAIDQKTSDMAAHPSIECPLREGFMLLGGGAKVTYTEPGNMLTTSYPEGNKWIAASKDHSVASPATVTAFAVGVRESALGDFAPTISCNNTVRPEAHPSARIAPPEGSYIIGGGGKDNYSEPGNMLDGIYPDGNEWVCSGKDHIMSSPATVTAYAIMAAASDTAGGAPPPPASGPPQALVWYVEDNYQGYVMVTWPTAQSLDAAATQTGTRLPEVHLCVHVKSGPKHQAETVFRDNEYAGYKFEAITAIKIEISPPVPELDLQIQYSTLIPNAINVGRLPSGMRRTARTELRTNVGVNVADHENLLAISDVVNPDANGWLTAEGGFPLIYISLSGADAAHYDVRYQAHTGIETDNGFDTEIFQNASNGTWGIAANSRIQLLNVRVVPKCNAPGRIFLPPFNLGKLIGLLGARNIVA